MSNSRETTTLVRSTNIMQNPIELTETYLSQINFQCQNWVKSTKCLDCGFHGYPMEKEIYFWIWYSNSSTWNDTWYKLSEISSLHNSLIFLWLNYTRVPWIRAHCHLWPRQAIIQEFSVEWKKFPAVGTRLGSAAIEWTAGCPHWIRDHDHIQKQ